MVAGVDDLDLHIIGQVVPERPVDIGERLPVRPFDVPGPPAHGMMVRLDTHALRGASAATARSDPVGHVPRPDQ